MNGFLIDTNVLSEYNRIGGPDPGVPRSGRPIPTLDSLIAATALAHNLVIITRNTKDFEGTLVSTHNPWSTP
jgi:predicted nucleic acid-binding protein